MSPAAETLHTYGNVFLAVLYFVIFLLVFKDMILPAGVRSVFSISLGMLFFLVASVFLCHALNSDAWQVPAMEAVWFMLASVPGLFYMATGAKNRFNFSFLGKDESRDRFDKLKEEFLSVASHELRTPLSVINGFAEILVREKLGPLNDEQKRRVRKILLQGQRLNRIIDELLDLSRIRRGKIECRKDVFDLIPVLKACIDDHQIVCEQQKITLIDQIPDMLPDVTGDIERVTQIIVNILSNAIKYTDTGGQVTISAEKDNGTGHVKVTVSDTGIGIDAEDQAHVFREFFRAQHRHTKRYTGSGLGLTIVKQLVEAQGGTVGVFSEGLGKGSRFYFTLPAHHSRQAA